VIKIGISQVVIQGMTVITIMIIGDQEQGDRLAEGLIALMFEEEAKADICRGAMVAGGTMENLKAEQTHPLQLLAWLHMMTAELSDCFGSQKEA
jgi:hypothetical protein